MSLQVNTASGNRRVRLACVCLVAIATLLPVAAAAKQARACTAGTTLRLSAPQASQGSLLLIEIKSTMPLAEVQGESGELTVPIWQDAPGEKLRKGLLAAALEKAHGDYQLKRTCQTDILEKISCISMVAARKRLYSA